MAFSVLVDKAGCRQKFGLRHRQLETGRGLIGRSLGIGTSGSLELNSHGSDRDPRYIKQVSISLS